MKRAELKKHIPKSLDRLTVDMFRTCGQDVLMIAGRANNIAEEIADVKIVLEQMEIIFQNGEEVNEIIRQKTKRLDKILQDRGE